MDGLTQEEKVNQIYTALIGDKLGNPGLVARVKNLEEYQEADRAMKLKITGGLLVIMAVGSTLVTGIIWLLHRIGLW